ncbi:MAG: hypothetical protein V9F03_05300 [Microthrixaceae bacterium]
MFGNLEADQLDALVQLADTIFAEHGAEGGPSLFGEDAGPSDAAPPPVDVEKPQEGVEEADPACDDRDALRDAYLEAARVGENKRGGATPCTAPSISTRRHEGHGGFTENGGAGEPRAPQRQISVTAFWSPWVTGPGSAALHVGLRGAGQQTETCRYDDEGDEEADCAADRAHEAEVAEAVEVAECQRAEADSRGERRRRDRRALVVERRRDDRRAPRPRCARAGGGTCPRRR